MKIPWPGNRCILCLRKEILCEEHLIPKSLGGRLTSNFLCQSCNSTLGYDLESAAKSDPNILLAVKAFEKQIPSLANALIESQPHIGQSKPGSVRGHIKDGEFRVFPKKLDDGSLIQPTDDARKTIMKTLKKKGYEEIPIQKAMEVFDNAPEDKMVEVIPGHEVVKWSVQNLNIDLSGTQIMDPLIPAKIAYEFMACHIGTAIYSNFKHLSQVRHCFTNRIVNLKAIQVDRPLSNRHEPFHGICFEGNNPYAKIQIRLFGSLAFRVHFLHLSIGGPRFVYTHRLDTGKDRLDQID